MSLLKSFGRFWYDFIIGDDWKIAAAVALSLTLLVALLRADVFGDHGLAVIGGAVLILAFVVSLAIDVRPGKNKD
jgi:hypothetical protein